ncbi:35536_t:CDS:2 [Gigaspora margarita]|uniref:35536_t:CDS:1 n=1 Tax=Gigaspora margarita TaxID=4874 RepID=A0ABM8W2Z9_GIGMA|nr:35536_t:CDS:2 [Gigaspora margarita]
MYKGTQKEIYGKTWLEKLIDRYSQRNLLFKGHILIANSLILSRICLLATGRIERSKHPILEDIMKARLTSVRLKLLSDQSM